MKKKQSRKQTVSLSLRVPNDVLRVFEYACLMSGFQMHEMIEMLLALEVAKNHANEHPRKAR